MFRWHSTAAKEHGKIIIHCAKIVTFPQFNVTSKNYLKIYPSIFILSIQIYGWKIKNIYINTLADNYLYIVFIVVNSFKFLSTHILKYVQILCFVHILFYMVVLRIKKKTKTQITKGSERGLEARSITGLMARPPPLLALDWLEREQCTSK